MARQSFFLGTRFLGSREIEPMRLIPGLEVRHHFSYAHFCGRCGDVWARIILEGATWTQLEQRLCPKHANHQFSIDGRLSDNEAWLDSPIRYADDWPEGATRVEFDATLSHYLAIHQEISK